MIRAHDVYGNKISKLLNAFTVFIGQINLVLLENDADPVDGRAVIRGNPLDRNRRAHIDHAHIAQVLRLGSNHIRNRSRIRKNGFVRVVGIAFDETDLVELDACLRDFSSESFT